MLLEKSTRSLIIVSLIVLSFSMTLISKEAMAVSEGTKDLARSGIDTFGKIIDWLSSRDKQTSPQDPNGQPPINQDPNGQPPINQDPNGQPPINQDPNGQPPIEVMYMMQQLQQFWMQFEMQLGQLPPPQQQYAISYARMMIAQQLAPYPLEQQQEAVNLLKQTMSPDLAQALLS